MSDFLLTYLYLPHLSYSALLLALCPAKERGLCTVCCTQQASVCSFIWFKSVVDFKHVSLSMHKLLQLNRTLTKIVINKPLTLIVFFWNFVLTLDGDSRFHFILLHCLFAKYLHNLKHKHMCHITTIATITTATKYKILYNTILK